LITAVDINVLLDVFGADVKFGETSAEAVPQKVKSNRKRRLSLKDTRPERHRMRVERVGGCG
jgi:hypothetical protein